LKIPDDFTDRDEMLLRFGVYCGLASRLLQDNSYARRWHGHAEDLTVDEYWTTVKEIHQKLLAAGKIREDEDPLETLLG